MNPNIDALNTDERCINQLLMWTFYQTTHFLAVIVLVIFFAAVETTDSASLTALRAESCRKEKSESSASASSSFRDRTILLTKRPPNSRHKNNTRMEKLSDIKNEESKTDEPQLYFLLSKPKSRAEGKVT